ncbi:MAG: single-stranded DNA-binding protein [Dehalococcoidia bacterium]
MTSSLNRMTVIGNLGGDPEMRYTPNGRPVTSFSVATTNRYTVEGEQREETQWFRISTWNRTAEVCNQYLSKGSKVYVEGRLQGRQWEGQDGVARFSMEINADRVLFLDRPSDRGADRPSDRASNGGEPMVEFNRPDFNQPESSGVSEFQEPGDDLPF